MSRADYLSSSAVEGVDIVKRFGERTALKGVSFSVDYGEILGFIGPDGAGKTTLFRILTTLLLPDSGRARVLGLDVADSLRELRSRIGYMPGRFSLYPDLSVEENLRFFASIFGTTPEAQRDLIDPIYLQIEPFRRRRAADLSGGMKQKLALSCALVHRPDILFLDEPTTGVDAVSRREFWDLLSDLRAGGLTIVVSTPYMDEADRCDRVALIQKGEILVIDRPEEIGSSYPWPLFSLRGGDRLHLIPSLRSWQHARSVYPFGDLLHYTDQRSGEDVDAILSEVQSYLSGKGFSDVEIRPIKAGIEDSFMDLMGRPEEVGS